MKKLLFINGHMNLGGAEKSLLDILKHIDYSKYHVELLLLEEFGDYVDEIPKEVKVKLFDLHNTYGNIFSCVKKCVKQRDWKNIYVRFVFVCTHFLGISSLKWLEKIIVGREKYDCVIAFRPGIATNLAAYAVHAKKRITWWHHGEINLNENQQNEYEIVCGEMDRIIVVSDSCAKLLADCFPMHKGKITVIPNMIDTEQLRIKANSYVPFDNRIGVYNLVTVGRLSSEKHIENVIIAAKALAEQKEVFRWFVIGDGEQKLKLEQMIRENGIKNVVFLVGRKENPYPYMKQADLFVHPSYVESQGLVVLEAMTLGVPCVVTKSLGPCEFIKNGVTGLLTEQSPESLTEQVIKILQDKMLYEKIKENVCCPDCFKPETVMELIYWVIEEEVKI